MSPMALTEHDFEELSQIRRNLISLKLDLRLIKLQRAFAKAYNPAQPRVPPGHGRESGRWTDNGSWAADGGLSDKKPHSPFQAIQLAGEITGFTRHGINQAINRGVSPATILDAVKNPLAVLPQPNGATRYVGRSAVVVLNPAGMVITVWGQ